MKSSLCAAYITELIYFPLKITLLYKLHSDYFSLCQSVILSLLSHEEIYLNICRNVRGVLTFVIHCIYKQYTKIKTIFYPVSLGYRIHQLLLCRGERSSPPRNECPGYNTKQSDGDIPVMLELWGMWNTPSLPSLPDHLWPVVVTQVEQNCVLMQN